MFSLSDIFSQHFIVIIQKLFVNPNTFKLYISEGIWPEASLYFRNSASRSCLCRSFFWEYWKVEVTSPSSCIFFFCYSNNISCYPLICWFFAMSASIGYHMIVQIRFRQIIQLMSANGSKRVMSDQHTVQMVTFILIPYHRSINWSWFDILSNDFWKDPQVYVWISRTRSSFILISRYILSIVSFQAKRQSNSTAWLAWFL